MPIMILPVPGIPAIHADTDLSQVLATAISDSKLGVKAGDVLVVCQKIVSKAEGHIVALDGIEPSDLARRWAEAHEKDPRLVELVFRESNRIVRMERGNLIVETGPGWICANAGIDQSNAVEEGTVTLLPLDADASAEKLREGLRQQLGVDFAVIVTDTFGRPWREGQVEFALGVAGLNPIEDLGGTPDLIGRELGVTQIAAADQLASAAGLAMGKSDGMPAILIRGWVPAPNTRPDESGRANNGTRLIRPTENDLFR